MFHKSVSLVVLAALLLAALAATGAGILGIGPTEAAPAWAAPGGKTDVIMFFPKLQFGGQAQGHCWTSSNILPRRFAWRCMIGNNIYDPCFSPTATANWVACGVDPLNDGTGAAIRVTLTEPLQPDYYYDDTPVAWYVQLNDGTMCYPAGRDSWDTDWGPITYICAGSSFILGEVADDGSGVWYANRVELSPDGSTVTWGNMEAVGTVWY